MNWYKVTFKIYNSHVFEVDVVIRNVSDKAEATHRAQAILPNKMVHEVESCVEIDSLI